MGARNRDPNHIAASSSTRRRGPRVPASSDGPAADWSGGSETAGDADSTSTGAPTGGAEGCGAIDFLFVVDNSGSMADEQASLVGSLGPFMAALQTTEAAGFDPHVMVVDVDAWWLELCGDGCPLPPECVGAGGACDLSAGGDCLIICASEMICVQEGFECGVTAPLECEDVLGAGVTHPRGTNSSNMDCNFASGARYIDGTEPNLEAALGCAAQVGTGSLAATERPMEAMVAALGGAGEVATCNAGFLRPEALLVVTFATDEDDGLDDSAGDPFAWHDAVVAAKGGNEDAVVVLGLFGDNDLPGAICPPLSDGTGARAAPRLRTFLESFGDHGLFGSVCEASYDPFFEQAAPLVAGACTALPR